MSWTVAFEPINPRYLVPIFPPAVILLAVALHSRAQRSDDAAPRAPAVGIRWAIAGALTAFVVLQGGRAVLRVSEKVAHGAGGYATTEWMASPLLSYVEANPPAQGALTNGPDVVFWATGRRLDWAPRSRIPGAVEAFRARLSANGSADLFWFSGLERRTYVLSLAQLRDIARLEVVHAEPDGEVYLMAPIR
jgi:hypothetical protein